MEVSIKLHTKMSGWSSLKIDFVLTNSVDPDEMQQYAAFPLDLTVCLSTIHLGGSVPQRVIIHSFLVGLYADCLVLTFSYFHTLCKQDFS